jgi:hypothetical protein
MNPQLYQATPDPSDDEDDKSRGSKRKRRPLDRLRKRRSQSVRIEGSSASKELNNSAANSGELKLSFKSTIDQLKRKAPFGKRQSAQLVIERVYRPDEQARMAQSKSLDTRTTQAIIHSAPVTPNYDSHQHHHHHHHHYQHHQHDASGDDRSSTTSFDKSSTLLQCDSSTSNHRRCHFFFASSSDDDDDDDDDDDIDYDGDTDDEEIGDEQQQEQSEEVELVCESDDTNSSRLNGDSIESAANASLVLDIDTDTDTAETSRLTTSATTSPRAVTIDLESEERFLAALPPGLENMYFAAMPRGRAATTTAVSSTSASYSPRSGGKGKRRRILPIG